MKQFMDKDFLLSTDMAKTLYHDFAENVPILDYHCHINPQEIAEDRKFREHYSGNGYAEITINGSQMQFQRCEENTHR